MFCLICRVLKDSCLHVANQLHFEALNAFLALSIVTVDFYSDRVTHTIDIFSRAKVVVLSVLPIPRNPPTSTVTYFAMLVLI